MPTKPYGTSTAIHGNYSLYHGQNLTPSVKILGPTGDKAVDTLAIYNAMTDPSTEVLFLRNGVYSLYRLGANACMRVNNRITPLQVVGESMTGTVLKLDDTTGPGSGATMPTCFVLGDSSE